jgi:hypothetical protein
MSINLHNYEEFFILYVDNELNAADRQQVEEFVQKNLDLKEELNILMQYKLVPDNEIVFEGKDQLLRHEAMPTQVELDQLRESLLLYVDDELNAGERIELEEHLGQNPSAKQELELLFLAKLQPEEITFPDKTSLYRTTEVPERILGIPPRWWKVAAAAIFLLGVGLTIGVIVNKKSAADKMAKVVPVNHQTKPVDQQATPSNVAANKTVSDNPGDKIASVTPKHNKQNKKKAPVPDKKFIPKTAAPEDKTQEVLAINNPKSSNTLQETENVGTIRSRGKEIAEEGNTNENINPKEFTAKFPVTPNTTHALYPETASKEDLAQSGGKKSRFRGLFRKLTRTFEKNTNINAADDDRVLIGGLAIKL